MVVFFIFFIVSLFLGDGKQPFLDIFWALGILTFFALRYARLGSLSLRPLPRTVSLGWTALLLYIVGRTVFSDSIAYSVTATVRLVEGYLLFIYFYTIASENSTKLLVKGLITTGLVAIGVSWILLFFPTLAEFLPLMNLLYANYGHNHLADLLLPIFPLVMSPIPGIKEVRIRGISMLILTIYILGMILTFARAAWVLLILYLLVQFLWRRSAPDKRLLLSIACLFLVLFSALAIVSVKYDFLREGKSSNTLVRQIVKRPLTQDSRWGYWKQAAMAIAERPFFGSGPGTFYLQSKRLQEAPQTYSWFSHSFPLETVVELGLVGAMLMAFVLIESLRRIRGSPLFLSACLILAYSFFEFNLSYLTIWLLLWSMLGLGLGSKSFGREQRYAGRIATVTLCVLTLFYLSSIAGLLMSVIPQIKSWAFFAAPFYKQTALDTVQTASDLQTQTMTQFNRRDPEVLYALAQTGKKYLFEEAVSLDPYNSGYHRKLIELLIEEKRTADIAREIRKFAAGIVEKKDVIALNAIRFDASPFLSFYSSDNREVLAVTTPLGFAKLFYFLGLSAYPSNPSLTKTLWTLARGLAQDWSYFSVELASLEQFGFQNSVDAEKIVKECIVNKFSRQFCERVRAVGLPVIGSLQNKIRAINTL